MRVVFLDIDGVLLPFSHARKTGNPRSPFAEAVALYSAFVVAHGVVTVISSSWRRDDDTASALKNAGFTGTLHRDWRTTLRSFDSRGAEIAEWLARHAEVDAWAILDDDSDMLPDQAGRHVQPQTETGLLPDHLEALERILFPPTAVEIQSTPLKA